MASVEQREATHPAGLTTLELFDKYKELEEDKDSDEESFHLPMLDSEEDLSINSKFLLSCIYFFFRDFLLKKYLL